MMRTADRPTAARRVTQPISPTLGVKLIVAYIVAMPFLVGLPRGTVIPLVRPSEALQMIVTAIGVGMAGYVAINGRRWRLHLRPIEWWLLAMAVAASVLPVLWLIARSQPVGQEELLATFPFVKYAALYLLVRVAVGNDAEVATVTKALLGAAAVIAAIAISQALGTGPVIDILGRFFVSSTEDVVDGGRGTTTIGSSIATGAYLSMACGLALSRGFANGNRNFLALAGFLAMGALASGQAGSVLALAVVVLVVARRHGRMSQLLLWGVPAAAVGMVALWPIVAARLADLDQGSGLPESWVIRWNNVSELYLPSLIDGGWVLGVTPDAILAPPDVWRDAIYLESGYLWLLWVGGLPLLVAAIGFLVTAWRALATGGTDDDHRAPLTATRIAGQAAVAMIVVLSLLDPHLTLRAGADLFFVLIALGLAGRPLVVPVTGAAIRWRSLLAADHVQTDVGGVRLQFGEGRALDGAEATLVLNANHNGVSIGTARLALVRRGSTLRGHIIGPIEATDDRAAGVLWRGIVIVADSLRLRELRWADEDGIGGTSRADRAELKFGAELAEKLEIERVANQHRFNRSRPATGAATTSGDERLPAIRLDLGHPLPRWKRAVDLGLGGLAIVLASPLWLATAALVRRSSPGPILYRQVRIGTGGLPFQIYKFRTMYVDNDDAAHRAQNKLELRGEAGASKDSDDPRITPIGGWLRRLSLDELPQLINVMRSEMSLVGPRPSLLWESELFQPPTRRRLTARPGLTGLWQISGRADVSMSEMLELDLDYVDRMGPMMDLRCLVGTVTSVAAGEGAR